MDLRLIKKIIRLVEESDITELEVEEGGLRIRVERSAGPPESIYQPLAPAGAPSQQPPPASPPTREPTAGEEVPEQPVESAAMITSPMVGTFYRSPSPDAPPFVQLGSEVDEDAVVCILEAMKVMNEIKAGCSGTIQEILVENGQPVEFGQPLFRVAAS